MDLKFLPHKAVIAVDVNSLWRIGPLTSSDNCSYTNLQQSNIFAAFLRHSDVRFLIRRAIAKRRTNVLLYFYFTKFYKSIRLLGLNTLKRIFKVRIHYNHSLSPKV